MVQEKQGLLFALKDVSLSPAAPRLKERVTVKGKIDLFRMPFVGPLWVLVTVTYPEKWWEAIIPIIGAPSVRQTTVALAGHFETTFITGFDREGEYAVAVRVYAGPTAALDSVVIPPAPAIASFDTKFTVSKEGVPEEGAPGAPSKLVITAYNSVSPPNVLPVKPGATIRVVSEFDYVGPATTGKFHTALWHTSWYDPHNEIAYGEAAFTLPDSPQGNHIKGYVDITVPLGFSGTDFGLYTKVTGGIKDTFSPYYANIITIVAPEGTPPAGVPAADIADFDFKPVGGTYNPGARVPFTADFKYKGQAQAGQLTISLGTGVAPAFLTAYTLSPIPHQFSQALDWTAVHIEGSFILPGLDSLIPGQTYSVRARLETLKEAVQETDTDFGAIAISRFETLEVNIDPAGAGYVTVSPQPSGGSENSWLFPYGTTVYVTAHAKAGYVFDWWSGEMKDTQAITAPVYQMTEHRQVTAHFKPVVVPPEAATPEFSDLQIYAYTEKPWQGATCYVHVMFSYKGPAITKLLYAALGRTWVNIFDEYLHGEKTIAIAAASSWETRLGRIEIDIPLDARLGVYDLQAKIDGGVPVIQSPTLKDVVEIIE